MSDAGPMFPTPGGGPRSADGSGSSDQPTQHAGYPHIGNADYPYVGAGATQMSPHASVPASAPPSYPPGYPPPGRPPGGLQPQHWAVLAVGAVAVIAIVVITAVLLNQEGDDETASSASSSSTNARIAVDDVTPSASPPVTTPPAERPSLAGTWIGEYRNTAVASVQLTITDPDELNGTIVYNGRSPCTESWRETGRSASSVYVDEERIAGDPDDCWSAKWDLTINGDTIAGTMTQRGPGFGATIVLRKQQ